ncbi:putative porin [Teredinibacter turnerae]|uniref:putative porin n=1 Tax=Teredinibacter turnerae TaxID=2426 RepID=UPI000377B1CA|nr:putative porin [Teredinibacter turnerae]
MRSSNFTIYFAVLTPLFFNTSANAEEYQFFLDAHAIDYERAPDTIDSWGINTTYYFDKKNSLGPLNEFSYINTSSFVFTNIRGSNETSWNEDLLSAGGMWNSGKLTLGGTATVVNSDSQSGYNSGIASIGWFFTDNLYGKVDYHDIDDAESYTTASLAYDYHLSGNDYIGSTISYSEAPYGFDDSWFWNGKYFNDMGGRYLILSGGFSLHGSVDAATVSAAYYFNKRTGVQLSYANEESKILSYSDESGWFNESSEERDKYVASIVHYFNTNTSLTLSYEQAESEISFHSNSDLNYSDTEKTYQIEFGLQF